MISQKLYVAVVRWSGDTGNTYSSPMKRRSIDAYAHEISRLASVRSLEIVTAREAAHMQMVADYVAEGLGEA